MIGVDDLGSAMIDRSPTHYETKIRRELLASLGRLLDEAADANQGEPRVLAVLDWLREQAGIPRKENSP